MVVDGSVNGGEFLQTSHTTEAQHRPFPSPKRLVRIFTSVVQPAPSFLLVRINEEIVMSLQESGIAAPSTTKLNGKLAIRVNITNHRSVNADFDLLVEEVIKLGRELTS